MVEAPALMEDAAEGEAWGLQTLALARNADGLLLMVDLSQDPVGQYQLISRQLETARIFTRRPKAKVDIEKKHPGAGLRIMVLGRLLNGTLKEVENLLKGYQIKDATVRIQGEATIEDVEEAVFESTVYRPALILANKADTPEAKKKIAELKDHVGEEMKILPISCKEKLGLDNLGLQTLQMLDIIRVYTKEPSKGLASKKPFTLRKGSTILDLAKQIHSDFYRQFSYARIWSERLRFSPQKVGETFVLEDGDIVEIHMR